MADWDSNPGYQAPESLPTNSILVVHSTYEGLI